MNARTGILVVAGVLLLSAVGPVQMSAHEEIFTVALTGDSIITRPLSVHQEPEFLKLIEIIRRADVACTNVEILFHDYESHRIPPEKGLRAAPALAKELAWAGFDLGSLANNHSGDFGVPGMRLTRRYLAEAGLVGAGTGESLAQAREAKFFESSGARVALIAVASSFPDHSRAGKTRGDMPARPGLNPLRFSTKYVVPREHLETLRQILHELGFNPPAGGDELRFPAVLGKPWRDSPNRFVVGNQADVLTEPDPGDLAEIAAVVRNARRLADYTIVSIHAHEARRVGQALVKDGSLFVPAQFLVTFARAMIDAGADVFVGHGPHVLRGIEIYRGKPIFYSLGNFIFQTDTVLRLAPELYEARGLGPDAHVADYNDTGGSSNTGEKSESVIAVPHWKGGELTAVYLHPISLGSGKSRRARGRPMLADADLGKKIIGDLQRLSRPFGTKIEYRDGKGVILLSSNPPTGTHRSGR